MITAAALASGCGRGDPETDTPGGRMEAAAIAAGLVSDGRGGSVIGSWAREGDRLCVVPAGTGLRIGVSVDYGPGQGCVARGSARRSDDRLDARFGACRIAVTYDGETLRFPATVPAECEQVCAGRATLAAVTVERLSASEAEAAMVRGADGRLLCGD